MLGQSEERKLAQLERLCLVQGRKIGSGCVVGVGAVAEDFEEREMGCIFGAFGEGKNLWRGEEFGEDKGVGC